MNYHILRKQNVFTKNGTQTTLARNSTKAEIISNSERNEIALVSLILILATHFISSYLRKLRYSHFFSSKYRRILSDFGVPIAMISVVGLSFAFHTDLPRINIQESFRPTDLNRKNFLVYDFWLIPWYWIIAAILPAICVSILLFMETGMTGLLINKDKNLLRKGAGYNLDLFVIAVITGICSVFGLTWMCPGPVRSVQHQNALAIMSRTHAPGEKPYLLHIKEQRMTNLLVYILTGNFFVVVTKVIEGTKCFDNLICSRNFRSLEFFYHFCSYS